MTARALIDSRRLADQLLREFGDARSGIATRATLVQAITDLNGSIRPESLPEMAVRLARVRLGAPAD